MAQREALDRSPPVLRYVYLLSAVTAITCAGLTVLYIWHHQQQHAAEADTTTSQLAALHGVAAVQSGLVRIMHDRDSLDDHAIDAVGAHVQQLTAIMQQEPGEHGDVMALQLDAAWRRLHSALGEPDSIARDTACITHAGRMMDVLDHLRLHQSDADGAHHTHHVGSGGWNRHVTTAGGLLLVGGLGMAWLLGVIVRSQRTLVAFSESLERKIASRTTELAQKNRALSEEVKVRRRLEEEVVTIASDEQRRIAHHLHDDLGQRLTATAFTAKILQRQLAKRNDTSTGDATQLCAQLQDANKTLRGIVRGLYPAKMSAEELHEALRALAADSASDSRIRCTFHDNDIPSMPNEQHNVHVYGIAREAVTNAIRHAAATQIDIRLCGEGTHVQLSVTDDGVGFQPDSDTSSGMGLRLIRCRADVIGAKLHVRSTQGDGTSILVDIPEPA